jgi:DNA-directed RNA polymerase subunit M/transcription elongation factor TFIIS
MLGNENIHTQPIAASPYATLAHAAATTSTQQSVSIPIRIGQFSEDDIYKKLVEMDRIYRATQGLERLEESDAPKNETAYMKDWVSPVEYMERLIESEKTEIVIRETGVECPRCHKKMIKKNVQIQDRSGDEGASSYDICGNENCGYFVRTNRG